MGAPMSIGLIVGGGATASEIIKHLNIRGSRYTVFSIRGWCDPDLAIGSIPIYLNEFEATCNRLDDHGIHTVAILMSGMRAKLMTYSMKEDQESEEIRRREAGGRYDNKRILISWPARLRKRGFKVIGPQDFSRTFSFRSGQYGSERSTQKMLSSAHLAIQTYHELREKVPVREIVVRDGNVLETQYWGQGTTDDLLMTLKNRGTDISGAVMAKFPIPRLDRRIFVPVVGPDTVERMSELRMHGLVFAANRCFVIDKRNFMLRALQSRIHILVTRIPRE
jgi:DUF1009 family protein